MGAILDPRGNTANIDKGTLFGLQAKEGKPEMPGRTRRQASGIARQEVKPTDRRDEVLSFESAYKASAPDNVTLAGTSKI